MSWPDEQGEPYRELWISLKVSDQALYRGGGAKELWGDYVTWGIIGAGISRKRGQGNVSRSKYREK
jgi:hypothetical protein